MINSWSGQAEYLVVEADSCDGGGPEPGDNVVDENRLDYSSVDLFLGHNIYKYIYVGTYKLALMANHWCTLNIVHLF